MRPLADPAEIQGAACRAVGDHLGTDRTDYVELNPEHALAVGARDDGRVPRARCPRPRAATGSPDVVPLGRTSRDDSMRFNAIKRRLDGITQRVLTQTLRKLERNGMVTRTVIAGRVLGVGYALTPLGRSLEGPFSALFDWTVENMGEVQGHQRRYDAQEGLRDSPNDERSRRKRP